MWGNSFSALHFNNLQVTACVETLCKYIDNVIENPTEEKYRKIRKANRVFKERVNGLEGAVPFLEAAGFSEMDLPTDDGQEQYWVCLKSLGQLSRLNFETNQRFSG